ncbi:MAG: UDP-N-acetylglucosamine 2-epimerase [Raoultibacter sp.]
MREPTAPFRVCVATGSRAEYHLLQPLIKALYEDDTFDLRIVATGAHLAEEYGLTYTFIEEDGFVLDEKIPILDGDDSALGVDRALAAAIVGFGEYFNRKKTDVLIVLGDRYEMLGVAFAAVNHGVAVAHIHGGETTEGAIDEVVRHSITKMSQLHFTSCEPYRQRVIQLGEDPSRVFNVGSLGVENIRAQTLLDRQALAKSIGFSFDSPCALVTYHPTTLGSASVEAEVAALCEALDTFPKMGLLFTKANADAGGRTINALIESYAQTRKRCLVVSSLGTLRYLSSLAAVDVVIGNSSSGILETAPFGVAVVNIGDRQRGRLRTGNVIDCDTDADSIRAGITQAFSPEFRHLAAAAENPYGDGFTSKRIVAVLKQACEKGLDRRKVFFDLD